MTGIEVAITAAMTLANMGVLACALWPRRPNPLACIKDRVHNP